MKALLTAYATVDANTIENSLKELDKNASFTTNEISKSAINTLMTKNVSELDTIDQQTANALAGVQIFKDLARGCELNFILPSGKEVSINNTFTNTLNGKTDIQKALAIFKEIKRQVADLDDKDRSASVDFFSNFAAQGMLALHMPDSHMNKIDISGDNCYKFAVDYSQKNLNGSNSIKVDINVQGKAKGSCNVFDREMNFLGEFAPTTNAAIVFTYDKSTFFECNNKASNIEVKSFEQEIGDVNIL